MNFGILTWMICFGLSFAFEKWNWAEQGEAFFYLCLCIGIFCFIFGIFAGIPKLYRKTPLNILKYIGLWVWNLIILGFGMEILFSWAALKILEVDFYVAYQIIVLGKSLRTIAKRKK